MVIVSLLFFLRLVFSLQSSAGQIDPEADIQKGYQVIEFRSYVIY